MNSPVGALVLIFFFFKQKAAYEMRISDWSSDVCSSDLPNEQLSPTVSGRAWRTAYQKASTVWPDRLRPDRSVKVIEIISGRSRPKIGRASCRERVCQYV